ncbi:MAG: cyclase family protein [Chlamydiales bacterium]|nr:cyclase family protein [Chlamydiales bacterium]
MLFKHYIDLTHPLSPNVPTWNGSCGFCLEIKKDYSDMFRVQQIKMHAGVGTHMDAASHRFQGGKSIADIPLKQLLFTPIHVIDVSQKAHADYEISVSDMEEYEKTYGSIPENALVIGFTGWHRFWQDPKKYRNVDSRGQMHFPAFSADAAKYLVSRNIAGIAIDTLSPDCLDTTYPVHHHLLANNKYIIENIADCSLLPPQGSYGIALPLRAEEATESPIRLVAVF